MKIGHFYRTLGRGADGASVAVLDLAQAQTGLCHSVELFGWKPTTNKSLNREESRAQKNRSDIIFIASSGIRNTLSEISKLDVLHIHAGYYSFETYVIALLAVLLRIPYVYSPHGALSFLRIQPESWKQRVWRQAFGRFLFTNAKWVHVFSEFEATIYQRVRPNLRVKVIPNGATIALARGNVSQSVESIDGASIAEHNGSDQQSSFRVGFVGRLDVWTKGLDILLDALRIANLNCIHPTDLLLLGPDWKGGYQKIQSMAAALGVTEHVSYMGEVARDQVAEYLESFDVVVIASRFEGFPLVFLEACAASRPVIVSNGSNVAALAIERKLGMVADTAEEIAEAIAHLREDPRQRMEMGYNGRRLACELTWEYVAEKTCSAYQSLTT